MRAAWASPNPAGLLVLGVRRPAPGPVAQRLCASFPHAHRPQATQQIQLPRWVQAILRLPGGVIILALIMLPITLVRVYTCVVGCCLQMLASTADACCGDG